VKTKDFKGSIHTSKNASMSSSKAEEMTKDKSKQKRFSMDSN